MHRLGRGRHHGHREARVHVRAEDSQTDYCGPRGGRQALEPVIGMDRRTPGHQLLEGANTRTAIPQAKVLLTMVVEELQVPIRTRVERIRDGVGHIHVARIHRQVVDAHRAGRLLSIRIAHQSRRPQPLETG